ncbi:hypothetical protein [Spiroplasma endosymbiont of Glossina fuscipes fuscipes]|uniref:hypothetical protein n=1 Tax=Spiroplasma endosymbiont of Glossina fuscipes fuscipes TaxID=2004463 RepID=UPI003C7770FA
MNGTTKKPFNTVDNKYYYVVWRGDKNNNWRIVKFINNDAEIERFKPKKLDEKNNIILYLAKFDDITLSVDGSTINVWNKNNDYFKSVYRWNLDTNEPDLIVDNDGTVKVKGE